MNRNDDRLSLKIVDLYIKMSESLSLQEKALMVNHFINKGLVECENGEELYQVAYRIVNDALDVIIDCNNNHLIDFLNFMFDEGTRKKVFYDTLQDCLDDVNHRYHNEQTLDFSGIGGSLIKHNLSYNDLCSYYIHDKFMIVDNIPNDEVGCHYIQCLTYEDIREYTIYRCINGGLFNEKFIDSLDLLDDDKQSDTYFELNRVFDEIIVQTLNNNLV